LFAIAQGRVENDQLVHGALSSQVRPPRRSWEKLAGGSDLRITIMAILPVLSAEYSV